MKNLSVNAQYVAGICVCMVLYIAALLGSIELIQHQPMKGPLLWFVAVLPALPIGGTIIVFLRYIDQVDEYVRGVVLKRFILATGLMLFLCTAWGFLEDNAGLHHVSLYLIYPLWWMLFGAVSAIFRKAS